MWLCGTRVCVFLCAQVFVRLDLSSEWRISHQGAQRPLLTTRPNRRNLSTQSPGRTLALCRCLELPRTGCPTHPEGLSPTGSQRNASCWASFAGERPASQSWLCQYLSLVETEWGRDPLSSAPTLGWWDEGGLRVDASRWLLGTQPERLPLSSTPHTPSGWSPASGLGDEEEQQLCIWWTTSPPAGRSWHLRPGWGVGRR